MSKKKRVWTVTYLNKDNEVIDQTQIDEKSETLAWDLFKEFGHIKQEGDKINWKADWELAD